MRCGGRGGERGGRMGGVVRGLGGRRGPDRRCGWKRAGGVGVGLGSGTGMVAASIGYVYACYSVRSQGLGVLRVRSLLLMG